MQLTKEKIFNISRILIAVSLIVYLSFFVELDNIIRSLENVDLLLFIVAFSFLIPNLGFQFLKWKYLLNSILDFRENNKIARSLFVGLSSGIFTPMRLGEYYGRSLDVKERSISEVAALTFVDKFFVLVTVVVIGGIFFVFFVSDLLQLGFGIRIGASLFMMILLALPFIVIQFKDSEVVKLLHKSKMLHKFFHNISSLKKIDSKILLNTFFFSVIIYLIYTFQYAILISAFSKTSSLFDHFVLGNVIMFSKALIPQISFGELGVRESTSVFYSSFFKVSGAAAFNASILIFVINLLIPAIIGFLFITKKSK